MASFALVFGLAFLLTLALTPLARRVGLRLDLADRPGGRRAHKGVIPRLGGVAMYAGFIVAVLATLLLPAGWLPPPLDPHETIHLTGPPLGRPFV
nr:hypothetical protein [Chloroflexota bacterium]